MQAPPIPAYHGDKNRYFWNRPWYPLNLAINAKLLDMVAGRVAKTDIPADTTLTVALYRAAHGRTGDKGNRSNISVIAWHPALWPVLVEQIFDTVQTINRQGVTILLVEQNAAMALSIAERGYVLETGRLPLEGPARELADNPEVRRAYLGEA